MEATTDHDRQAPRVLIVTADDFGSSHAVNAAVAMAHSDGILTSTSLLVTGAAVVEAVELARERPRLSTGLHLALCDATPASPPHAIRDLLDARGEFPAAPTWPDLLAHWFWRSKRGAQLEREIRTQIERYLETGLPLDHIDGHHHLQMHPVVFEILMRCLEDYDIRWVRLVDEDHIARRGGEPLRQELVAACFALLAARHRRALARSGGARGPERSYGLRATGKLDLDEWLRFVPLLRADVVEVFCHPDRSTVAGQREIDALCSPVLRCAIEAAGYRLVGSRWSTRSETKERE